MVFKWFCQQNFTFDLYDYQEQIAEACLSSLLVASCDVFIKLARQSGKTEMATLLLRFLIIFYRLLVGDPLTAGMAEEFYRPYAKNWILMGKGNHETSVTNKQLAEDD